MLACFLGGATEKWSEGIVVGLLGLILLAGPPRFSLGRGLNLILLAIAACAAMAFLPASWFLQPAWRLALENDFGITLPGTLSPQPWVSLGCFVSFLAGLSWLYYVSVLDLELREVRQQLRHLRSGDRPAGRALRGPPLRSRPPFLFGTTSVASGLFQIAIKPLIFLALRRS